MGGAGFPLERTYTSPLFGLCTTSGARTFPWLIDLHQEQARPGLHQFGFGRALFDFHAAFGVDVHFEEHVRVQDRFEGAHRRGLIRIGDGLVDAPQFGRREGLAQVIHGLFELAHLLCQRL